MGRNLDGCHQCCHILILAERFVAWIGLGKHATPIFPEAYLSLRLGVFPKYIRPQHTMFLIAGTHKTIYF
jgi:hypothetical protein